MIDEEHEPTYKSEQIPRYHARETAIQRAKEAGIAVGAIRDFQIVMGFGRRSMAISNEEAKAYTLYQISAIGGMCKAAGVKLQHVKPTWSII